MKYLTRFVPRSIKNMVPGYRARWHYSYAALLEAMAENFPLVDFSEQDGEPKLTVKSSSLQLFGMWTEAEDFELFKNLRPDLPNDLRPEYFRLLRDYLTRYLFPHLRPDLKPSSLSAEQLTGFHGQHKDTIRDFDDAATRELLTQAFAISDDDVIIDCGSFLGFGEVRIASESPNVRIVAVEASAACYPYLERNLKVNNITNVTPLHRAVWNEIGELELESGYAQNNSLVSEVVQGKTTQSVKTITIDAIVEEQGLERVDMLSLTLNGAEVEALAGAERTLAELRPRIRLAGWYTRSDRRIADITGDFLEHRGYQVFKGPRGNTLALPG